MATKLQQSRTDERDALRFEYFDLGLGYYIAGRAGYHAKAIPVAANLFHHAIEMFMKGYLTGVGVDEDGRRKLAHKLNRLWNSVRSNAQDPSLDRFTAMIAELDRFEILRYPEGPREKFSSIGITWGPKASTASVWPALKKGQKPRGFFHCDIDEMDRLAVALFKLGSVNPAAFIAKVGVEGSRILKKGNRQKSAWLPGRPRRA